MRRIKTGGRTAGVPNKDTRQIRENFELLVQSNLSTLKADIKSLKPIDRLKIVIDLAKFVVPTLKAVEVSADIAAQIEVKQDLSTLTTEELIERANAIRLLNK